MTTMLVWPYKLIMRSMTQVLFNATLDWILENRAAHGVKILAWAVFFAQDTDSGNLASIVVVGAGARKLIGIAVRWALNGAVLTVSNFETSRLFSFFLKYSFVLTCQIPRY